MGDVMSQIELMVKMLAVIVIGGIGGYIILEIWRQ